MNSNAERLSAQLDYISNIYHTLHSDDDIAKTLDSLPNVLPTNMQKAISAVYVSDPAEGLMLVAQVGADDDELAVLENFNGQEYLLNEIMKGSHASLHLTHQSEILQYAKLQAGIVVPLLSSSDCIGVLFIGFREAKHIDAEIERFIQTVGIQIGQVIALSTLFKKIKYSEMRYRSLFENASCSIFVASVDGTIQETNKQGEILLGSSREEIIGKRFKDYFISPFREKLGEWTAQLAKHKFLSKTEIQVKRSDDSVRTVDGSGVLVEIGKESFVFMIGTDVTEYNQLRSHTMVTDKLATMGLLAAGVAHEINNPIACIMSNLAFINEKIDDQTIKTAIEESLQAGERVKEIVDELNIYTKKDEKIDSIDLRHEFDSAINMAYPEWRSRARIEKNYDENLPLLKINRGKIHQVFLNLMVNASHAIMDDDPEHHKITITIKRKNGKVIIIIEDTGVGISHNHMQKIFDPFFTTKPVGEGTGLGLFVCHEIVKSMNGNIYAQSEEGKGTRFFIELPIDASEKHK